MTVAYKGYTLTQARGSSIVYIDGRDLHHVAVVSSKIKPTTDPVRLDKIVMAAHKPKETR